MFIDAHNHIDFYRDDEIRGIIGRAREARELVIVNNATNPGNFQRVIDLSKEYKEIKVALGIYPIDALSLSDNEISKQIEFIKENNEKIVAIGEVGLDFKEDQDNWEKQRKVFNKFVELSIELNKPVIVHSRKAELECIAILEKLNAKKVIMHCFSGKLSLVKRIIDNKWTLTIPTSVKNAEHFQKVIEMTPITQLLCETDSPYLHPDKKNNNEPSLIIESYKKIAEIKKISLKEVEKLLEKNYNNLFNA